MTRTQYYNMHRAYRVISNRNEQHPNNWENWMHTFPYGWRFEGYAPSGIIARCVEQASHWRTGDEEDRRDRLKRAIKRNIRNNLEFHIR